VSCECEEIEMYCITERQRLKDLPKNGIRKAATTVDITSAVLIRMKHQLVLAM
jgi:hypothetical protein